MATVQLGTAPLQPPPLQLVKVEPLVPAALSVTVVPVAKSAAHVPGQEIPLGILVTVPVPVPARLTVSRSVETATLKRAVTVAFPVKLQAPVPEQPPLQPANAEPGAAAALRETVVPS